MKAKVVLNPIRYSTIKIYLPKEIAEHIQSKSVVVYEMKDCLVIRESTIDDYKTLALNEKKLNYIINYTSKNAFYFVGDFEIDIEEGKLILYRDDEQ